MSEPPEVAQPVFAAYPVFRRREDAAVDPVAAASEWEVLLKDRADRITARAIYTASGFRPDADLLLWLVASSADDVQDLLVEMRRTELGAALELTHSFVGVHRPPEFNPQHVPAFLRGERPRRYLCVYPFVRSVEWYLQPAEERARLLAEHGEMGREFPDVLPNTTSAFGLGDWEWILAFEADELPRLVDCIRRLRDSASRRFVKVETPFVVGIRKELAEVVSDLA
ncbi:MAG TPA: hydrogen peroxide-dependent heme synthase [Actinomycetota bacterium]|nr:hydrogen peroxide-dependent heme synthase [Actinomycetota bacterium]